MGDLVRVIKDTQKDYYNDLIVVVSELKPIDSEFDFYADWTDSKGEHHTDAFYYSEVELVYES